MVLSMEVDLYIIWAAVNEGHELDIGTPFDGFGKLAKPRCESAMLQRGILT